MCCAFASGTYSSRPVTTRKTKGTATTQCSRREPGPNRSTVPAAGCSAGVSVDPAVELPATLLPVAGDLVVDEFNSRQPLWAFVAVHVRRDQAQRQPVLRRERL